MPEAHNPLILQPAASRHDARTSEPKARGRATGGEARDDADHARIADLIARRETLLGMFAETDAELRRRGIVMDQPTARTEPQADHLVPAKIAAVALRVHEKTIRRWSAATGLGWKSVTGRFLVDLPALQKWRATAVGR